MARKHDVKEIHLQIDEFIPCVDGFIIEWSSDIGWGEYTIYKNEDGKWCGDSECVDSNDDKKFISELMNLFIEQLLIE